LTLAKMEAQRFISTTNVSAVLKAPSQTRQAICGSELAARMAAPAPRLTPIF